MPPPGHLLRRTLIALSFFGLNRTEAVEPAMIEVRFAITDPDNPPLQFVPARVMIGEAPGWRRRTPGIAEFH